MSITIGNVNPINAAATGLQTADNGLTANTPTNVELGGAVTKTTQLVLSNNSFFINGGSGTGSASFSVTGGNDVFIFAISNAFNEYYFHVTTTSGEFGLNAAGTKSVLQALVSGLFVLDNNFNIGIVNAADYSANIVGNPNALTSVAAVQLLINAVFNPALYALVAGQVFTGNISAPNLSGTNTGDQNLTPYALLASPTFTGTPAAPTATAGTNTTQLATTAFVAAVKALCALLTGASFTGSISATNLSGTNTGDQNLTPYALLAGAAFTGAVTAPTSVNQIASNNVAATTVTVTIFSVTSRASVTVYRINSYYQITAFTAGTGTLAYTYTDINGTVTTTTITVGNSVGDAGVSPRILAAKASTTISLTLTIVGGLQTANVGGNLELLY